MFGYKVLTSYDSLEGDVNVKAASVYEVPWMIVSQAA